MAGQPTATVRGHDLVAWHVGRHGEVAGGMTQVVNAYAAWDFESFDIRVIPSRDGSRGLRAYLLFLRAVLAVRRLRDPERNLVVVHLSQGGSFVREGHLLRLASRRGFSTIAHLHGSSFVEYANAHPERVGPVLRAASRVFVLSEATRASVAGFIPEDRIAVVPNAVASAPAATKQQRVVFGGKVSTRKGVDVLVDAWRALEPDGTWHLEIAGPVAEPELVPADLPHASVLGSLPHAELLARLESAAVAVLPSRDEAMPMFVLEAMARDACVIATDVGGIPAVLGDGSGILVPAGDAESLRVALHTVMTSEPARRTVVERARQTFTEHYSASALYPRLERLWRDALDR